MKRLPSMAGTLATWFRLTIQASLSRLETPIGMVRAMLSASAGGPLARCFYDKRARPKQEEGAGM
jgi:hypothetical protein